MAPGASGPLKLASAAAVLLALACIAMAGSAFWKRRRLPADAVLPVRAAVVLAAVGALVLGGTLLLGSRNLLEHGVSVYQNQVHVPLIIKYPNQHQPRVVDSLVSQVDVMPTVLAALGFEAPKGIQGETLQEAENDTARPVFSEFFRQADQPGLPAEQADRAIFLGGMKLIASAGKPDELYDLARDPEEKQNLFRPDDNRATALAARLNDWVKAVPVRIASSSVDQDEIRRLRALGYAQQP